MSGGNIAVIDIGKTNAKLALVDAASLDEIAVVTRPNRVLPGPPWPHFDVDGHWKFLLDALSRFHRDRGISAISVTTHGACAALLGEDGKLAAPILDYEHEGPDEVADAYNAIRAPFYETGSPRLSGGLNIGAQLYWQFQKDPDLKRRVRHLVTYPQYWGFRLTGVAATDVTSLGCHTDLWNPHTKEPSSLVEKLGLADILAPTRRPDEILGPLLPEIAAATGLDQETPVYCGIHDSNASLLPHLVTQKAPFSVVSTGTWVITMAIGGRRVRLDPAQDTLVNVNALGEPVPSARFMGGREYDLLTQGQDNPPSEDEIAEVLGTGTMLLPSVVADSGPFQGQAACWVGQKPSLGTGQRSAAIDFYLALTTAHCLNLIGAEGPIHVEGPFAKNRSYIQMLGAATARPIIAMTSATGTSQGAAILGRGKTAMARNTAVQDTTGSLPALSEYAASWQTHLAAHLRR